MARLNNNNNNDDKPRNSCRSLSTRVSAVSAWRNKNTRNKILLVAILGLALTMSDPQHRVSCDTSLSSSGEEIKKLNLIDPRTPGSSNIAEAGPVPGNETQKNIISNKPSSQNSNLESRQSHPTQGHENELHKQKILTPVPVVGVITQVFRDYRRFNLTERHLHLPASYVKWLEAAGARVVPIMLNRDDAYYRKAFAMTNGLLLPGGDNLLDPKRRTPLMEAAKKLYALAMDANQRGDHYPIWGTCLGFELLTVLSSGQNRLVECDCWDESLPIEMIPNCDSQTRLFAPSSYLNTSSDSSWPQTIVSLLGRENVSYNHHHKCVTDESLRLANLSEFYKPIGYSADRSGIKFISIFEARKLPFYGVQFHPEKPPFEFQVLEDQLKMPHSPEAIATSRYFGDFFVNSCRLNGHPMQFPLDSADDATTSKHAELELKLIYAYKPTYFALEGDMYEQRYLFPFDSKPSKPQNSLVQLRNTSSEAENIQVNLNLTLNLTSSVNLNLNLNQTQNTQGLNDTNKNSLKFNSGDREQPSDADAELDLGEFMDFVPAKGEVPSEDVS